MDKNTVLSFSGDRDSSDENSRYGMVVSQLFLLLAKVKLGLRSKWEVVVFS